jgi:hypothetical protein
MSGYDGGPESPPNPPMSEQDPVVPAVDDAPPPARSTSASTAPPRCSICGTLVREAEPVKPCPDCLQDYHAACWDEIGGCATYGCKSAAVAEKPPPPDVVHAGWGDDKTCPVCEQSIASSLLVCPCGARFPWADPLTREQYDAWRARARSVEAARKVLVALFVLSVAGFGAPIAGPVAAYYAHKNRQMLVGPHGVYLAMGYGSAALGAAYVGVALVLAFA